MKIAFVDLETTGLSPKSEDIIEAACIVVEATITNVNVLKTIHGKVKPDVEVSDFIRNLTGYNEEEWERDSVHPKELYAEIFSAMEGCWHAGSNPVFDDGFLKVAASKHNITMPKLASYHYLDVTNLYFDLLLEGKVEKLRQETVAAHLGIEGGGHRALSDAKQCLDIFKKRYSLL
jgi:DNA polymerase III epsilon subunit-like protein